MGNNYTISGHLSDIRTEYLDLPVTESGLGKNTCIILKNSGITTIGILMKQDPQDLYVLSGLGSKSIQDIEQCIKRIRQDLADINTYIPDPIKRKRLNADLSVLQLSAESYHILMDHGIETIGNLAALNKESLSCIQSLTKENIREITDISDQIIDTLHLTDAMLKDYKLISYLPLPSNVQTILRDAGIHTVGTFRNTKRTAIMGILSPYPKNIRHILRVHTILQENPNTARQTANTDGTETPATDHLGLTYPSIREMCQAYGIDEKTFRSRLAKGLSTETALTMPVAK